MTELREVIALLEQVKKDYVPEIYARDTYNKRMVIKTALSILTDLLEGRLVERTTGSDYEYLLIQGLLNLTNRLPTHLTLDNRDFLKEVQVYITNKQTLLKSQEAKDERNL